MWARVKNTNHHITKRWTMRTVVMPPIQTSIGWRRPAPQAATPPLVYGAAMRMPVMLMMSSEAYSIV